MSDWHEMADGQRVPWKRPQLHEVPRVPRAREVSDSSVLAGLAICVFFWAIGFAMGIFAHVLFAD